MNLPPNLPLRLWQAFWLLLLLAPFMAGALYVWHKHQWAQATLADAQPRFARLAGVLQSQPIIADIQSRTQDYLEHQAFPASQTVSQAGNDAQQRVRQLFVEAGLSIISLQVQEVREEADFDRIPLTLRAEGTQPALTSALQGLQKQRPSVAVQLIEMQVSGPVRPDTEPKLSVQLQLTVLRARS